MLAQAGITKLSLLIFLFSRWPSPNGSLSLSEPNNGRGRQVTRFEPKVMDITNPSERMRQVIDSPCGRPLYSQRCGTVEPVFGNIHHNKRMTRLNHRGRTKVSTQRQLYCMVHNIGKLAKTGLGQTTEQ